MTTAPTTTATTAAADRWLGDEELIVTKTDLKGHLTYCNETFLQISALTEDEALGRPHNIIRDPAMPHGIFELLWQRVPRGEELFAYIRNRGADGGTYWVLAYVTRSVVRRGGTDVPVGYHSMRRAPRRAALPEVARVYTGMNDAERGLPRKEAAKAGLAWLEEHLTGRGLTYDTWVWGLEDAR